MFSRGGTLLPSIYADARYIDAVIVSKAAAGVGKIGVVDGDTIERGNLHRQVLHKESLVGTSKAVSIAMFVRGQ